MSFIGKKTIFMSPTILVQRRNNFLIFKGQFGVLKIKVDIFLNINFFRNALYFSPLETKWKSSSGFKSKWGTLRSRIFQIVQGIYKLHFLKMKFIGVGYKASLKKNILIFRLGFAHKIYAKLPNNIVIKKIKKRPPTFFIKSYDLNSLKTTAFLIRSFKKPEPYKGKGILLSNEFIKIKEGKKTKK